MPVDVGEVAALVDQIGRRQVVEALGIHRATLARWLAGERRPPEYLIPVLRFWASGRLPGMGAEWSGWRMAGGALVDPGGRQWRPADLAAAWAVEQALQAMQAHCRRIEAQLIAEVARQAPDTANDRFANLADVRQKAFRKTNGPKAV